MVVYATAPNQCSFVLTIRTIKSNSIKEPSNINKGFKVAKKEQALVGTVGEAVGGTMTVQEIQVLLMQLIKILVCPTMAIESDQDWQQLVKTQ